MTTLESLDKKIDLMLKDQADMKAWLWGKNGRIGDIVEIKAQLTAMNQKCDNLDTILCTHSGEIEVLKDWKKNFPKYIIGYVVLALGAIGTGVKGLLS